jgi:aerobic C4-dicarboxylate transport protein
VALAIFIKPGSGIHIDPANLESEKISEFIRPQSSFADLVLNIVPNTIFEAFTKGDILSILLISIIFGCALATLKDSVPTAIKLVEELSFVMFKILAFLMKFAPLGAFGVMSYTIGKYGLHSLLPLAKLMACFYTTCFLFVIFVLGLILKLCGSNIFALIKHIKEEIFLTIGTSSSEAALPGLMKKMENFGCPKSVTGLVIPSGYSFNLDGTCIYFTMAVIFLAQAFNINLSTREIISIILYFFLLQKVLRV